MVRRWVRSRPKPAIQLASLAEANSPATADDDADPKGGQAQSDGACARQSALLFEEFALLVFEGIDFDGGARAGPDDPQG
jgi:hypothetical protein